MPAAAARADYIPHSPQLGRVAIVKTGVFAGVCFPRSFKYCLNISEIRDLRDLLSCFRSFGKYFPPSRTMQLSFPFDSDSCLPRMEFPRLKDRKCVLQFGSRSDLWLLDSNLDGDSLESLNDIGAVSEIMRWG